MQNKSFFHLTILAGLLIFGCKDTDSSTLPEAPFPCEDGMADGQYPCENVDMFAFVSIDSLTNGNGQGVFLNDIWGWTDPQTNKEYALVGLTNGVSFVDITDPEHPVVVGVLPESNLNAKYKQLPLSAYPACNIGIGKSRYASSIKEGSSWRDQKVFNNHMFVVSDAQPHGMQVFDLTKLRDFEGEPITFQHDALYDRLASAHNIVINEATGFAYAVGVTSAEICGSRSASGLHMIDINDPKNPQFAGCYIETDPGGYRSAPGYIHDAQCVVYNGPDSEHAGEEICFNSSEGNLVITDVSDKEDPTTIGYNRVADMYYSHQGWLTNDQSYFLMDDELDEMNLGRNTKTYIWDVRDLENPVYIGEYIHDTRSIDHNLYIKNNYAFQSNYNSGLQILDISNVANANLEKVAFFDTQPNSDVANFAGSWSNYPYFESGMVAVSDINDGLFILRPNLDR